MGHKSLVELVLSLSSIRSSLIYSEMTHLVVYGMESFIFLSKREVALETLKENW